MNAQSSVPQAEDLISVGSRISWGAILGGGVVALAIYFMLTSLGAAVGLSFSDRMNTNTLQTSALAWSILTLCVALFVGGMMSSLFTVGENKVEAVMCGVIMWAFVLAAFIWMGTHGARAAATGVIGLDRVAQSAGGWENAAREAGVPSDSIEEWRRKVAGTTDRNAANDEQRNPEEMKKTAKRLSWYVFGGTWISMLAAALGAWMGAGPTFRVVRVDTRRSTV
ncbi:MAG: hypothetical protein ACJ8C4_21580 [Gemmataceae bacterium]